MMKKIILAVLLMTSASAFSQCNILGKSSIGVSEPEIYAIENTPAQCKECHLWVNVGGNSTIESDNKLNSIKLKGKAGGREILSLTMLTPSGIIQCSKNIEILDATKIAKSEPKAPNDCDIDVNDFKEVKYSEGVVSFFPSKTANEYKYTWVATYFNGEKSESNEKVPQFPYTKANGIEKINLKIVSKKCIRNSSKTYDSNYWFFF